METSSRSWTDPRDGTEWDVQLHTSRTPGEEEWEPEFFLLFRSRAGDQVLPLTESKDPSSLGDDDLSGLLDEAEPNQEDIDVWYHISEDPEQAPDGNWIPRARIFISNESEARVEWASDPEAERYVSYEEAAEESRGFGESHVLREYSR